MEAGFNGGVPIDEAFFRQHISGRHNPEIAGGCFLVCVYVMWMMLLLPSFAILLFSPHLTPASQPPSHLAPSCHLWGPWPLHHQQTQHTLQHIHTQQKTADLFPEWSEERRVAFYTNKEQRFRDMAASKLQRMPGLTELIAWANARGLSRAAVTNAPHDNAVMMLAALQLDSYFGSNVVLGEECARAKPHPEPYLAALELLGLQAHQAIVIEDSPAGVRAAVAAGLPCFGITSGQAESVLYDAGCCLVMDDFHALVELAQSQCAAGSNGSKGSDGSTQRTSGARTIKVTA